MANYEPFVRSSYFEPKSVDGFKAFCERWGLHYTERTEESDNSILVGFYCDDYEGSIPDMPAVLSEEEEGLDEEDFDFWKELVDQLGLGWAIEVREIGHEKMRYLTGVVNILAWNGWQFQMGLDDAHFRALAESPVPLKLTAPEY